jgi:hypothetical protein
MASPTALLEPAEVTELDQDIADVLDVSIED